MKALQSRKQLLLLESELNRALLLRDMAELTEGLGALTVRAEAFTLIFSSAAGLVSSLAASRRGQPADAGVKPSWLPTLLKGAGLASTLWVACRARGRDDKDK
jgi:hypothetical protein